MFKNFIQLTTNQLIDTKLQPMMCKRLQFVMTGGNDGGPNIDSVLNSAVTLTTSGWDKMIPHLPVRIYFHCMAKLDQGPMQ